jgi:hypothetical protein
VEQLVARQAHNLEVTGSSPVPASVLTRIQHHPARAALLSPLVERLGPDVPLEVVEDPDPDGRPSNPWRCYRECLISPSGSDITHLLVIQDDAVPCRNLVAACERIRVPGPVCLFLAGAPVRLAREASRALSQGRSLIPLYLSAADWLPVVAVLWPVEVAESLLEWAGSNRLPGDPNPRSDDAVCGRWARQTGAEVFATVPSLVEHEDLVPSLIGKKARQGRSKWRTAGSWIGADGDALEIFGAETLTAT